MIRRIWSLTAVTGVLAVVAACGASGTTGATATAIYFTNQTITANFQATRTTTAADFRATSTAYAQSSTRTASERAATVSGTPRIGTTTEGNATPSSSTVSHASTATVRSPSTSARPAGTAFRDAAGRFSFLLPPGWSVQQSPVAGVAVAVVSTSPRGSANVATEPVAGGETLDQYTAATVATIAGEHADYRIAPTGIQPTTLGSYPARRYSFSEGNGGASARFVQYVALVGTTAYALTLTCAESDSPPFLAQAQVLVDSFAFEVAAANRSAG